MKRAAVIGSIITAVAAIVFAFIIGGGDGIPTEAKSLATVSPAKQGAEVINAGQKGQQDQSGGPTTSVKKSDDNKGEGNSGEGKNCKAEQKSKYETKAAFLGLDPTVVRAGRKVEFELKNFRPCATVFITYTVKGQTTPVTQLTSVVTDKNGKAEGKFTAPAANTYTVTASDGVVSKSTTLTVK